MLEDIQAEIETAASALAQEVDSEIFEVKVRRNRDALAIVVIADLKYGGISLDQCTFINQHLVEYIDSNGMITEDYTLEVNSPGLDAPLKTWRDFERVKGRQIHFHLKEKVEDKLEHIGTMLEANEEQILVETKKAKFHVDIHLITKATQVIKG